MSIVNTAPAVDVRKIHSGKDGGLYDGDGELLVSVESFQSQLNVTNASYQPLGTAQERAGMTSFKVTLTFSEIVVNSSKFFQQIIEGMQKHQMPTFNFRGMVKSPYDDSEEQVVYRDCVPDGTIDIQNMQPGELYKRAWSFVVNQPPELQSLLLNN